jgi:hypothetical protein
MKYSYYFIFIKKESKAELVVREEKMSINMSSSIRLIPYEMFMLQWTHRVYDQVLVYFGLPASLVGFVLNVISFRELMSERCKNSLLNTYLKAYCLISAFILALHVPLLILQNRLLFPEIANTYLASASLIYFIYQILTVMYLYRFFIDIAITFEKICVFMRHYRNFLGFRSLQICIATLILSLIVNLPSWFETTVVEQPVLISEQLGNATILKVRQMYILSPTAFIRTWFGGVLINIVVLIRSFMPMIVLALMDAYLIRLFRKHFKRKINLLSLSDKKSAFTVDPTHAHSNNSVSNAPTQQQNSTNKQNLRVNKRRVISNSERKAAMMTILICFLGIIESSLFCLFYITRRMPMVLSIPLVSFISTIYQIVRYSSNFFLFILFGSFMRKTATVSVN